MNQNSGHDGTNNGFLSVGIGSRIRELRGSESLNSFAKKLGVHKNTLARYERETSLPDVGIVIKLCEISKDEFVTPNWLINGDGVPPDPNYAEAHEDLRERLDNWFGGKKGKKRFDDGIYKGLDRGYAISYKNLMKYVEGKYLPTDKELGELCPVVLVGVELVESKRKPVEEEPYEKGFIDNSPYVPDIMKQVLVFTEECLLESNLCFSPEKKAELITLVYEEACSGNTNGERLKNWVSRLLKLSI